MCDHQYEEIARRFTRPKEYLKKATGDPNVVLKLTSGFTVIELHCIKCGDIQFRTVTGDQR